MLLMHDGALRRRFQEGEREAMEMVVEHYSSSLAAYLRLGFVFHSAGQPRRFGGLRDRHELHDALADTFRRALERNARLAYRGDAPYEGVLRTIARNLVIDRLKSKHFRATVTVAEVDEGLVVEEGSAPLARMPTAPDAALERKELENLVQGFLQSLSPDERRFVELRYGAAMPQRGLADELCCTRASVRETEKRVRRRLLLRLKHSGYLDGLVGTSRRRR